MFEEWIEKIKEEFCALLRNTMGLRLEEAREETEKFLKESEADLRKWWKDMSDEKIGPDDLIFLIQARLDAGELTLLKHAGLSLAALDRLKNGIAEMLLSTFRSTF